jgi:hypothetical protein
METPPPTSTFLGKKKLKRDVPNSNIKIKNVCSIWNIKYEATSSIKLVMASTYVYEKFFCLSLESVVVSVFSH